MKQRKEHLARMAFSLAFAGTLLPAMAQLPIGTHYPIGAEGLKGPSLPPPGLYFKDYNQFYTSDHLRTALPPGTKTEVTAYAQVPRLIYMTDAKVLGANYGMDVLIPLVYTDFEVGGYHKDSFGIGDMSIEPLLLSWHFEKVDVAFAYALWAPTGDFDKTRPDKPGKGFWGHMLTLGATYYFDKEKTWSISALNRYEFNHEQDDTGLTPGQAWSLEWSIGKSLRKTLDIGLVGYLQMQTTAEHGTGAAVSKYSVAGIGPEITAVCPKLGLFTSLRYNYEYAANERFQGHNIVLTFVKRF